MSNESDNSPIKAVRWAGRDLVVTLAGEVVMAGSVEFQRRLLELIDGKPSRMVVDLAGVTYMDSSGLASLIKLLTRIRKTGSSLFLVGLGGRVRGVFEVTRLDKVFDIRRNEQEALAQ